MVRYCTAVGYQVMYAMDAAVQCMLIVAATPFAELQLFCFCCMVCHWLPALHTLYCITIAACDAAYVCSSLQLGPLASTIQQFVAYP
jgi:hypothetical protein